MAQAMGADFSFGADKAALMKLIREHMEAKVPRPRIPDPLTAADLRLTGDADQSRQADILDMVSEYTARGLRVTFPTSDTWMMTFDRREDSGTMRAPLVTIVRCAKEMMR